MTVQQEIVDTIKKYDKIIIHRHLRPDPDALGSQVGLAELLRESFPEKEIRQVGETIEGLRFLAEMQEVEDAFYQGALVIVTDTANSPRISDQRYQLAEKLIKIDHHPNDDPYGDLVWVNTKASSCSEMIAEFALMFPELFKDERGSCTVTLCGNRRRYRALFVSLHDVPYIRDCIDIEKLSI